MDSFIAVEAVYSSMEFDAVLAKTVGRHSDASGYGFGTRDASWYFEDDEAGRMKAAECIQRLSRASVAGLILTLTTI